MMVVLAVVAVVAAAAAALLDVGGPPRALPASLAPIHNQGACRLQHRPRGRLQVECHCVSYLVSDLNCSHSYSELHSL